MSMRVIDLDNKPADYPEKSERSQNYDHLNNIANVELGKKIQAMTLEEKIVVAKNLPIDIMLDVIREEFKRFNELEEKLDGILKRFGK